MNQTITLPRAVVEQALDTLNTVEWSVVESCWIVDGERIDSAINTLRAVLEQPDTGIPASEQDDWKLVPVEPTQAMLRAAIDAPRPAVYVDSLSAAENLINSTKYRAMLAAAPQPPAVEQPQGGQEPDWQDLYRKEKRRAEMWIAKYEKDISKLQLAVPVAAQPQVEHEPDAFYEWWRMRPSLTRLQAWLIWKDEHKQPERAHGIGGEE